MNEPRGWYSRGYLPHIDCGSIPQFLTWRLADSVPADRLEEIRERLKDLPETDRKREEYRAISKYLDAGHGSCILKNPIASRIVQESLLFSHGIQYQLHAWVVMSNHVHVLLTPNADVLLAEIPQALKGFTSKEINKALGRKGRLWQPDYFDRAMRDQRHFERTLHYIEWNPVKAGLTSDPTHWAHSSASLVQSEKLLLSK